MNSWRWRVYTILCISSYFAVCVISRLLEVRFRSAAILCFCTHTVMKALPIKLSPLAFEKVGRDLWMTHPPSASWLHLLPSSITNTIWVIPPRTPVLSGTVPQSQAKAEAPRQRWRAGDGTQLEDTSAGQEAPVCVPVRWAELLPSRVNFLFPQCIAVSLKQTWGKDYEVWCNCYPHTKKVKSVSSATFNAFAENLVARHSPEDAHSTLLLFTLIFIQ